MATPNTADDNILQLSIFQSETAIVRDVFCSFFFLEIIETILYSYIIGKLLNKCNNGFS